MERNHTEWFYEEIWDAEKRWRDMDRRYRQLCEAGEGDTESAQQLGDTINTVRQRFVGGGYTIVYDSELGRELTERFGE
jgi:hypothetical protein